MTHPYLAMVMAWRRYEKVRRLTPPQWAALYRRQQGGESFDSMVDTLPDPGIADPAIPAAGLNERPPEFIAQLVRIAPPASDALAVVEQGLAALRRCEDLALGYALSYQHTLQLHDMNPVHAQTLAEAKAAMQAMAIWTQRTRTPTP